MKAVTTCARSSDEVLVSKVFGLNFGEAMAGDAARKRG